MIIDLNGEERELPDGTDLRSLIEAAAGTTRGCAAAVNGTVVPRSSWDTFAVPPGAAVEIITAVQGG